MIPAPIKVHATDFILTVEFEDGQIRQIDVRTFLGAGKKAESVKKNQKIFQTAYIEDGMSITWENGFSIDPDVIYEDGMIVNALPATGNLQKRIKSALEKIVRK